MTKIPTLPTLLLFVLIGCQSSSLYPRSPGSSENQDSASVLAPDADPYQSYQFAIRERGRQRAVLFLQATAGLLQLDDLDLATNAFAQIDNSWLDISQQFAYRLTGVRLNTRLGHLEVAHQHLANAQPDNRFQRADWYIAKGNLHAAEGNYASAANAALTESPIPQASPEDQQKFNDMIWNWATKTPGYLVPEQLSNSHNQNQRGWWQLVLAINQGFGAEEQSRAWSTWRRRWPGHSANINPPARLLILGTETNPLQRIALAIPLSGPLAMAGRSVRDGFISAYLHTNHEYRDLVITVYDSTQGSIEQTYQQALINGAEVFIGPLERAKVAELNLLAKSIPVIALNYLAEGIEASQNFYQLGIVVEDDVKALALRLSADQKSKVTVFHDQSAWSRRAVRALENYWSGPPMAVRGFDSVQQLTEAVGQAMLINASQDRHSQMQTLLGEELDFNPRAREDLEAVVVFAQGSKIGALKPALRYHFANHLPVYTTSQTLRTLAGGQYAKVNGFNVTEMPWKLSFSPLATAVTEGFGQVGSTQNSLQALGVDALRLALQLDVLLSDPQRQVAGSSGILHLQESGKFTRTPLWGVIRAGKLEAATPASR